jgi:hypothetical protein
MALITNIGSVGAQAAMITRSVSTLQKLCQSRAVRRRGGCTNYVVMNNQKASQGASLEWFLDSCVVFAMAATIALE